MHVPQQIEYRWRGPLTDAEMVALVAAHGGRAAVGWWDQVRPYSLGWVTARVPNGGLVALLTWRGTEAITPSSWTPKSPMRISGGASRLRWSPAPPGTQRQPLIGGFPIVSLCEQVDQPRWSGPEAAGIEVERRQVLLEIDV